MLYKQQKHIFISLKLKANQMKLKLTRKNVIVINVLIAILFNSPLQAQKVNESDVQKVALKVLKEENKESKTIEKMIPLGINNDTTVYIVSLKDGGFIILSADYAAPPILGFSSKGTYNPDSLPGGLNYLIKGYQISIASLREDNIKPTSEINLKWQEYLGNSIVKNALKSGETIAASRELVLPTKWQQGRINQSGTGSQPNNYNKFCPTGCMAGCVAVAMAQILYYWKWDVNQTGSNSFDGQTVNFGIHEYCYNLMNPLGPDDSNARLIYHAGVSCNTDYCAGGNEGSMAFLDNARAAFENFWGMSHDAYFRNRGLINVFPSWKNRLKNCIDNGRPILYGAGSGNSGHAWIIHGYDANDNFLCKWGAFDGFEDGYYSLGGFNPNNQNYNSDEDAVFDIYPATHVAYEVSGPETLTSQQAQYTIQNIADCQTAIWSYTSNIQAVYGGSHYLTVKAIGGGVGWLDAKYVINGQTYWAPRKYVNCLPNQ